MTCPKCNSENVIVQTKIHDKKSSSFAVKFFWFFAGLCTFGIAWILRFLLTRKKKETYATCQSCGKSWKVK